MSKDSLNLLFHSNYYPTHVELIFDYLCEHVDHNLFFLKSFHSFSSDLCIEFFQVRNTKTIYSWKVMVDQECQQFLFFFTVRCWEKLTNISLWQFENGTLEFLAGFFHFVIIHYIAIVYTVLDLDGVDIIRTRSNYLHLMLSK